MAAKRTKPEPLQSGDEQIAREEIEGYFTAQMEAARAELAKAQAAFDSAMAKTSTSLAAFHDGERLPDLDMWSIELHAGGVDKFHEHVFRGLPVDRAAYDRACERRDATKRWLRHQGYPELNERRA